LTNKKILLANITLLYPEFLWGLFLILIPILIHLFNFRRYKKIYFSNISFLKSIKEQTKFASRLKHFLILISRILMIAFLVLAFSQPYIITRKQLNHTKTVSIYIDNSFSMRSQPKKGTQLDVALISAKKIANSFPDDMVFSLITNNGTQNNLSKTEFFDAIQSIDFSPIPHTISQVVNNFISKKNSSDLFIISDFQKNIADINNLPKDSTHYINFIILENQATNNICIDSCWIDNPVNISGKSVSLHFSISVFPENNNIVTIPVSLFINDSLRSVKKIDLNGKQAVQDVFHFRNPNTETVSGRIQITDYPISFDNEILFSYPLKNKFHVLSFNPNVNGYINTFFKNDSQFIYDIRDLTKPNYTDITNFDFLIVNGIKTLPQSIEQIIQQFLAEGKNVLFVPAFDGDIMNYNTFFSKLHVQQFLHKNKFPEKIDKIAEHSEIFRKVFKSLDKTTKMPEVTKFLTTKRNGQDNSRIFLSTETNTGIFSITKYKNGFIYVLSVPDIKENKLFFTSPVFVPLLYNISTASTNAEEIYYLVGATNKIQITVKDKLKKADEMIHVLYEDNKNEFIPFQKHSGDRIFITLGNEDIYRQGFYTIRLKNTVLKTVAFNFNRQESDLSFLKKNEVVNFLTKNHYSNYEVLDNENHSFTETIKTQNKGVTLWRMMLLFSLGFLFFEILLLRFWK